MSIDTLRRNFRAIARAHKIAEEARQISRPLVSEWICTGIVPSEERVAKAIADHLSGVLPALTPDARLTVLEKILESFCRHCGTNDPRCQCWNDE